jgi:hypothetical protein
MKQALSLLLIASAIALPTASAFAASGQPASPDITRQQVRADLYRSFLTGTTANDENTPTHRRPPIVPPSRPSVVTTLARTCPARTSLRS